MRFHACRTSPRVTIDARSEDCQSRSLRCAFSATDRERQILLAVQAQLDRQLRWSRRSLSVSKVLGTAAVVAAIAAAQPLQRGLFLAAALVELGPVLCCLTVACRRLQATIALIGSDVDGGEVRLGRGRVRSLLGIRQVIQDVRRGVLVCTSVQSIKLAGVRTGERVLYRYAPNSRILVSLEGQEQGICEVATEERCQADAFVLSCCPRRRRCSPNVDNSGLSRVMPESEASYGV